MQISSFTSAAFDTARSTFKDLASAAVAQQEAPAPAPEPESVPEAPKPVQNQRQGVSLDSYA